MGGKAFDFDGKPMPAGADSERAVLGGWWSEAKWLQAAQRLVEDSSISRLGQWSGQNGGKLHGRRTETPVSKGAGRVTVVSDRDFAGEWVFSVSEEESVTM
jgi:hypothetical protein